MKNFLEIPSHSIVPIYSGNKWTYELINSMVIEGNVFFDKMIEDKCYENGHFIEVTIDLN